jgi:hypothetical protein
MEVPLMVQEDEGAQSVFLAEQTETMETPGPNTSIKDP